MIFKNFIEMLATRSSWQQFLFLGLLLFVEITAHSLPDQWNNSDDIQSPNDMPSMPADDNVITNTASLTLADNHEFPAQPTASGGDVVSLGILSIAQGSSSSSTTGCHPSSDNTQRQLPRSRMRARDEEEKKMCPAEFISGQGEKGRQLVAPTTTITPNGQQESGGGPNSGGSSEPQLVPLENNLPDLFIPKESRPRGNADVCPEINRPVPVCGRPSNVYISTIPSLGDLIVDPCYPCMCLFFFFICVFFSLAKLSVFCNTI